MYQCKNCGNKKEFIENYTDSIRVYISDSGELLHSEQNPQLIEVACVTCNASTEHGDILCDGEQLIIS